MLEVGFDLALQSIVQSLKNLKMVIFALVTNFVIIPIFVISVSSFLSLHEDVRIGFIILSLAAGAPLVPKLAQFAKANVAFAVALMTLLMVSTVIVLPLILPLIIPGVGITPLDVAIPLILSMLLPLGIALAIRHRHKRFAEIATKLLNPVTTLSLLTLLVLFFIAYWNAIIGVGVLTILFSLFFISFALAIGYLLSTKDRGVKRVSALGAAQRNIAAGLLVALVDFADKPLVGVTVLVISIVDLILLMIVARVWGRKGQQES